MILEQWEMAGKFLSQSQREKSLPETKYGFSSNGKKHRSEGFLHLLAHPCCTKKITNKNKTSGTK
jgi:hypothetical protein